MQRKVSAPEEALDKFFEGYVKEFNGVRLIIIANGAAEDTFMISNMDDDATLEALHEAQIAKSPYRGLGTSDEDTAKVFEQLKELYVESKMTRAQFVTAAMMALLPGIEVNEADGIAAHMLALHADTAEKAFGIAPSDTMLDVVETARRFLDAHQEHREMQEAVQNMPTAGTA